MYSQVQIALLSQNIAGGKCPNLIDLSALFVNKIIFQPTTELLPDLWYQIKTLQLQLSAYKSLVKYKHFFGGTGAQQRTYDKCKHTNFRKDKVSSRRKLGQESYLLV